MCWQALLFQCLYNTIRLIIQFRILYDLIIIKNNPTRSQFIELYSTLAHNMQYNTYVLESNFLSPSYNSSGCNRKGVCM